MLMEHAEPASGSLPAGAILLGTGDLAWTKEERQSDRYGFLFLLRRGNSDANEESAVILDTSYEGVQGRLVAQVVEARPPSHPGDWVLRIFGRAPSCGAVLELGVGRLRFLRGEENGEPFIQAGIEPLDGRAVAWMDIQSLHDLWEQTVALYFVRVEPLQ
jgi:hypothetical protein